MTRPSSSSPPPTSRTGAASVHAADPSPTPTDDSAPTPTDDSAPTPTDEASPTPTDEAAPAPTPIRRLVALPGMDGTGRLLERFAEALQGRLDTRIIAYPREASSYEELEALVLERLREEPDDYLLLGESFSGPIAVRVGQRRPAGLRGLVLAVTFAGRPPSALLPLLRVLPTELILSQPVPCWAACQLMHNTDTPEEARSRFCEVIREVSPAAIAARLEQVRQVSVPPTRVALPALYLQATADRVLPAAALAEVEARFSDLEVVRLRGPHLLLNALPEATADAVARFAARFATRAA